MANPFLFPQISSAPIASGTIRDEQEALKTAEGDATSSQRVIAIGSAIPVVFGKFADRRGGVWANPVAGRMGLQLSDTQDNAFSFGMVVSDGKIGPVADADIYKGTFPLSALKNPVAVNSYSAMPEDGFNYTFSSTVTTPGEPGTPDEAYDFEQEYSVNLTTGAYLGNSYSQYFTINSAVAVSLTLSAFKSNGDGVPFSWRLLADNVVVSAGSGNGSTGVSGRVTNNASWRIQVKRNDGLSTTLQVTLRAVGSRYQRYTGVTPGEPPTPPTYDTTGMPLSPGSGGTYGGMSCLAVRGAYEAGGDMTGYREQIRCFVRNGIEVENLATGAIESSDNFIDLAYYLLKKNQVSDDLIDLQSFRDARQFLEASRLHFNGTLAASVNLRSYFEAVAPGMLLKFVQNAGKFSFKPVLPIDSNNIVDVGTINPVKTFTNDNIVDGSFALQFYESRLRKPFCVMVSWREQFSQNYSRVVQEEIRYPGTAIDGPFEPYDYSEFITTTEHANLVGRYALSSRARITHQISFSTYLDVATEGNIASGQLAPMDIIRVSVSGTTERGEIQQANLYQVASVIENPDGGLDIEAIYFPTDEAGASLIAKDLFDDNVFDPLAIGAVQIQASNTEFAPGETITLTAVHAGAASDLSYSWTGPAGTNAPVDTETSNVLTWTAGGTEDAGIYTVTITSPTAPDSPKTDESELIYSPFLSAVGGTVTEDGDFKVHTFTATDVFEITRAPANTEFEYLICATGGNGNQSTQTAFGGGGGGGVLTGTMAATAGVNQITVGLGRGPSGSKNASHNSSAFGLTALAGGDGGQTVQSVANGGCGAGDAPDIPLYANYVRGYGSQGGDGGTGLFGSDTRQSSGGGGGGASGANGGSGSSSRGGNGGEGLASSITGSNYVYGSGGAGFIYWNAFVQAGIGGTGAGNGGRSYYSGGQQTQFNTPSTNYGAGGSSGGPNNAGVQGVVIIRYQFK